MQENFRVKGKKLHFVFVDLDRVPSAVKRWAMRKLGVEEWLVLAVLSMYTGAKTVVRTVYGNSMQLWRPESELDGINLGSWYHCLPIGIYH